MRAASGRVRVCGAGGEREERGGEGNERAQSGRREDDESGGRKALAFRGERTRWVVVFQPNQSQCALANGGCFPTTQLICCHHHCCHGQYICGTALQIAGPGGHRQTASGRGVGGAGRLRCRCWVFIAVSPLVPAPSRWGMVGWHGW